MLLNKSNAEGVNSDIMQSYFGRFNYNYKEKNLFEATIKVMKVQD